MEPFSDEEAEEDGEEEEEEDEAVTAECRDSEGEMEAKEQGEVASNDECIREEKEEDPNQEEEEEEDVVEEESEGVSHSQPQTEEQT